jgi:archaellum component FlaC
MLEMPEKLKGLLDEWRLENAAAHAATRRHVDAAVEGMKNAAEETRRHFDATVEGMKTEVRTVAVETRRLDATVEGMKMEVRTVAAETRRHFDTTVEGMKTEVQIVAEAVLQLGEKTDREVESIRAEMRQGFSDTQAMITNVDSRVRALEKSTFRP